MKLSTRLRWYLWLLEGVWSGLLSWVACLVSRALKRAERAAEPTPQWLTDHPGTEDQFHEWNEKTLTNLSTVYDP